MIKCDYCNKEILSDTNKYNIRYKTKEKINNKTVAHYQKRLKFCSCECKEKYKNEHKKNKICPYCKEHYNSIKHIDRCNLNPDNVKICPRCNKEHTKKGIYCSRECANVREHSEETKQKISNSVNTNNKKNNKFMRKSSVYKCLNCEKEFKPRKKNQKFCCHKCSGVYFFNNDITGEYNKNKLSKIFKQLYATGKIKVDPWKIRYAHSISFPEQFFMKKLANNNIFYYREFIVKTNNKSKFYYIDFALVKNGKKIDLEIDGRQHKYKERKESDKKRDIFLTSKNWIVYRVEWNEINTNKGKELMKQKIDDFLKFYESL